MRRFGAGGPIMRHYAEIDGLRAIAVLAVVAYHAFGLPAAGFVGVDVFFVISGYLITALLRDERDGAGSVDLLAFYARRIRRILPAMILVVAATFVAALALMGDPRAVAQSVVSSAAMVANFYFQWNTGGYFDQATDDLPLLHLWSLSVEEQFYLLWPLVVPVVVRWRWGLPLLLGLSLLTAEVLTEHVAFYQMPARFWELGLGGWLALSRPTPSRLAAPAGLALLLVALNWPAPRFPGFGAMPAVLGTALIIASVHGGHTGLVGVVLRSRPMVFFGLISYSLYLWHWPLLVFDRLTRVDPSPLVVRIGLCLASVVLAWLTWRYIEAPFRRLRATRKLRVVASGAIASVTVALLAAAVATPPNLTDPVCAQVTTTLPPDRCNSSAGVAPTTVLWGDSHAMAWKPFALAIASGKSMAAYTYPACPPMVGHPDVGCATFNGNVLQRIGRGDIDTLVIAARMIPSYHSLQGYAQLPKRPLGWQQLEIGMADAIASVAPHVRRIVILEPLPQLRNYADRCLLIDDPGACAMPREEYEELSAEPRGFLKDLAAAHPNVEIVAVADYFCDHFTCPAQRRGLTLYDDSHHITARAAADFVRWIAHADPGALRRD